ncbi:hypothetical protein ACOMHN_051992 [Nucella lapillus]
MMWKKMDKKNTRADSLLSSPSQRFRYILHFWQCREAFSRVSLFDFFNNNDKAIDSNTNKPHVDSSQSSLTPTPPWFDTSSTCQGHHPDPCVAPAPYYNDLDLSSQGHPHADSAASPELRATHQGEGDVTSNADISGVVSPLDNPFLKWQRWRLGFLVIACMCLSYVLLCALLAVFSYLFWRPSSPFFSSTSASSPSLPPSSVPSSPYYSVGLPPDGEADGDGCDWDCLRFLFN